MPSRPPLPPGLVNPFDGLSRSERRILAALRARLATAEGKNERVTTRAEIAEACLYALTWQMGGELVVPQVAFEAFFPGRPGLEAGIECDTVSRSFTVKVVNPPARTPEQPRRSGGSRPGKPARGRGGEGVP